MTDAEAIRPFVLGFLRDVGAEFHEEGGLVWVSAPDGLATVLGVETRFALAFDPASAGRFGAEPAVPGSYVLERMLSMAMVRGRWDVGRVAAPAAGWARNAAVASRSRTTDEHGVEVTEQTERFFLLFVFRVTFLSDEKRERLCGIVTTADGKEAWSVEPSLWDVEASHATLPAGLADHEAAYDRAVQALREVTRTERAAFRRTSLALLDEEVRRVLRYFDRTLAEIREATPNPSPGLLHAIETERDRRLAEAVERFDAQATATLCSVRAMLVPCATLNVVPAEGGEPVEAHVDAWTRHVRGVPCGCASCVVTGGGPAPPRGRPPSGTPRRGSTAARAGRRSSRGPRGRPRAASRRGP